MKIWCDAALPDEVVRTLEEGVGTDELVFSKATGNNLSAAGFSDELNGAEVAFGQPNPEQVIQSRTLKFVQITSAGYTRFDTEGFKGRVREGGLFFCNSSSVYDEPCAQHILAFLLTQARQIPDAIIEQTHRGSWIFDRLRPATRVLRGDKVLILGYGAIAKRLAELLIPFQLEIVALRRDPRGNETVPTFPIDTMAEHLETADFVINILPANASTTKLMDAAAFAKMKPGAVFCNIGRGTTVDQDALVSALRSGQISAALLDVTEPEPLPSDSPLWKAPNCVITPHIAGGFQGEHLALVTHFLANLARYKSGDKMIDEVFSL